MTTFHRRRRKAQGIGRLGKIKKELWIWWVWTAEPFLRHPILTIKDWCTPTKSLRGINFDEEDLHHLTPEERKALK